MKRILKSYLLFTPLIYRIVMFIIMPIVMIVIAFCIGVDFGHAETVALQSIPGIVVCMLLPLVEIIADNWVFGGIQSKDAYKLDYLKTSSAGMKVMRNALLIDLLRKFFSAVVIMCVSYGLIYWRMMQDSTKVFIEDDLKMLPCAVLVSYFFSVLGTVLARCGSMVWLNVMVAYLLEFITLICVNVMMECAVVYSFLPVILDVAISILAVRLAMKKVEGSYYDK